MNFFGPNFVFRVLSTRQEKLVKLRMPKSISELCQVISTLEFLDFATFGKSLLSEEYGRSHIEVPA